ncbi:MAG: copper resistance protein CopC, partial [Actinomycetota bacterium]|nr:copper resistance protein CopC [Actinomycetota bacterium]
LVVAAAAVLAVAATAPPAAAHAEFESSTPGAGATVEQLPRAVTLTFSEPVRTPAFVAVTGPSGTDIARGGVRVRDADLIQPVGATAETGQYAMSYRVTSADGHPISGTVRFTLAAGAGAGGPTPAREGKPQPAPPSQPDASGDTGGGLGTGQLLLLLAALAVGLGALALGTRRALRHSVSMVQGGKSGRSRRP